jgi:hypothetical protein
VELFFEETEAYYCKHVESSMTALEKLKLLLTSKHHVMKSGKKGLKAIILNPNHSRFAKKVREKNEDFFKPSLIEILAEGKASKEFKVDDPEVVAHFVFSLQDAFMTLPSSVLKNENRMAVYKAQSDKLFEELIGISPSQIRK